MTIVAGIELNVVADLVTDAKSLGRCVAIAWEIVPGLDAIDAIHELLLTLDERGDLLARIVEEPK